MTLLARSHADCCRYLTIHRLHDEETPQEIQRTRFALFGRREGTIDLTVRTLLTLVPDNQGSTLPSSSSPLTSHVAPAPSLDRPSAPLASAFEALAISVRWSNVLGCVPECNSLIDSQSTVAVIGSPALPLTQVTQSSVSKTLHITWCGSSHCTWFRQSSAIGSNSTSPPAPQSNPVSTTTPSSLPSHADAVRDIVSTGPSHKPSFSKLNAFRVTLQTLANLADGAFNVPGLKSAANIALQIVDIVKVK